MSPSPTHKKASQQKLSLSSTRSYNGKRKKKKISVIHFLDRAFSSIFTSSVWLKMGRWSRSAIKGLAFTHACQQGAMKNSLIGLSAFYGSHQTDGWKQRSSCWRQLKRWLATTYERRMQSWLYPFISSKRRFFFTLGIKRTHLNTWGNLPFFPWLHPYPSSVAGLMRHAYRDLSCVAYLFFSPLAKLEILKDCSFFRQARMQRIH